MAAKAEAATAIIADADARRTFWLLIGAIFTVAVNSQVINPVLPAIADDFGATVSRAGLAVTAYLLPYGMFQLLYGPIADRVGRVRVISVMLGVSAVGSVLCAIAPDLNTLIAFRFLTGGAAAAVIPLTFTYIGDTVEYSRRQAAIGYTAMSLSLGNVLAAAVGGLLAALVSWRSIFLIIALLSAIITVLILRQPTVRVRPASTSRSFLTPFRVALADRRHILYYLLVVFEGTIILGAFSYFGLVLRERDDFSYTAIGFVVALFGMASIVTARYLGRLASRLGERRLIAIGGSSIALGFVLMVISPPIPFFLLAMITIGFGYTSMHTTFQTRATELAPSARATAMAVFAFSLSLGGSIGSFVIAQSFDRAGFNPTLIGISIATVMLILIATPSILRLTQPHHDEGVSE